ncbi:MAG TPA: YhdP family protein [Burkholderiales bacterium]|nr:YhdP family protein [Burkholderiales bacterium]
MILKTSSALLKHGSLWAYRLATWAVLLFGLAFALGVIALRYWLLPNVDDWREPVANAVSRAVGQQVVIGTIAGGWDGFRPHLRLQDVRIEDRAGGTPGLMLERVDTVLSWVALFRGDLRFHSLEVDAPAVEVRRDPEGTLWIAGQAFATGGDGDGGRGGFFRWLLDQRQVVVRDAHIVWHDEKRAAPTLHIEGVGLRVDNEAGRIRFGITGRLPAEVASSVTVRGEFTGGSGGRSGRIYGELGYANLALLQEWVELPVTLDSGLGSTRFWLDLVGGRLSHATVDGNVVNLRSRLAGGIGQPAFLQISGRLIWQNSSDAMQVAAQRMSFTTEDGVHLPPVNIQWRQESGNAGRGELAVAGLPLAPLLQLSGYFPLETGLRARLQAMQASGTISNGRVAWSGGESAARAYEVDLEFEEVAFRPVQALPGVRGIGGRLQASETGGSLALRSMGGAVELPRVFAEPVPLDYLSADADWRVQGEVTDVQLRGFSFTNAHAAGNFYGTYRRAGSGLGSVDLKGNLVRADARQLWRYMPVSAQNTQRWLKRALVAGEVRDASFRMRGPLAQFPFADARSGEFEVTATADGVTLDFADGWPAIEGIHGELLVRGDRMEVKPRAARITGVDISRTQVVIPHLGNRDERLLVNGEAAASLEDWLRFVAASPAIGRTAKAAGNMRAAGDAQLKLALELPLHRGSDARVDGSLQVTGREFVLDPRVPPLTDLRAHVAFTRNTLSINGGQARLLGNPLRFNAVTRDDGAVTVDLSGRLDAAQLRAGVQQPLLALLDGATDWRGALTLRQGAAQLRIDSTLAGLSSRLPPPFDKAAEAQLPLRIELRDRPEGQELLTLALGSRASAQLVLERAAVRRGSISFGAPAALPSGEGIALAGVLETLDIEAWSSALPGAQDGSDASGAKLPEITSLDLRIGLLDFRARQFHDLALRGARVDEGWQLAVDGREVKGAISWAPAEGGRLAARLEKLLVPPPVAVTSIGPAPDLAPVRERLPGLDIVADQFTFDGMNLGRLELLADPAATSWTLQRLRITNPDGNLDVTGRWALSSLPKTDLDVRIEASDAGKLLARLGYPEGIRGGRGSLSGPVSWTGSPAKLDLPTLSGQLRLEARDGRFAQLEPGVGRLLGILSLQSLPRRFAFDFRDVFSSGFSFESITANVSISGGVAQTEDFRMQGPPARVQMSGTVGLADESQDLRVRVLPQLSTGVAIAGAVVNPVVGLAALIAQRMLGDPVEQIAAVDYKVTGTWGEPHVERLERGQNGGQNGGQRR